MIEIICGPSCSGWTLGWKGGVQDKHPAAFCDWGGEGAVIISEIFGGLIPPGCPRIKPGMSGNARHSGEEKGKAIIQKGE